jgi:hypothetical protein
MNLGIAFLFSCHAAELFETQTQRIVKRMDVVLKPCILR